MNTSVTFYSVAGCEGEIQENVVISRAQNRCSILTFNLFLLHLLIPVYVLLNATNNRRHQHEAIKGRIIDFALIQTIGIAVALIQKSA